MKKSAQQSIEHTAQQYYTTRLNAIHKQLRIAFTQLTLSILNDTQEPQKHQKIQQHLNILHEITQDILTKFQTDCLEDKISFTEPTLQVMQEQFDYLTPSNQLANVKNYEQTTDDVFKLLQEFEAVGTEAKKYNLSVIGINQLISLSQALEFAQQQFNNRAEEITQVTQQAKDQQFASIIEQTEIETIAQESEDLEIAQQIALEEQKTNTLLAQDHRMITVESIKDILVKYHDEKELAASTISEYFSLHPEKAAIVHTVLEDNITEATIELLAEICTAESSLYH